LRHVLLSTLRFICVLLSKKSLGEPLGSMLGRPSILGLIDLGRSGEKVFANAYDLFEPIRYSRMHWSKYLRLMALAYNCKMLCRVLIRSSLFLPIRLKKARGV